ncbi:MULTISPECIES: hemolysin family protein [unclassified Clostridium]|uniref:HlyC/CorC family transporter n=1 Tax=unclassified Clostridium TaxID=2614128 RepID=UPI000E7DC295|nr:hemolysin [Clostridium sp.]
MSSIIYIQIIGLIILIILSSFFSASETALMSISKIRVRHMVEENIKGSNRVKELTDNPSSLLASILVGNNVVNIASSSLATVLAINLIGSRGVAISTIIMTIVVLIFGEITPKTLASQNSEQISLRVANPIFIVSKMLKPVVIITTTISKFFIKLLGGKSDSNKPFITEDELKTMVDVSEEEGILKSEEKDMIHNVFQFGDLYAKDVMVQRVDIIALDIEESLDKIISVIKEEGFSRIPIYSNTIDNIVGILNVKDIIFMEDTKGFSLKNYMREITYTYEFRKVTELFKDMNKNRQHMVVVLDEYGGTVGIVTIEDLIEEIVGDISDEYDDEEPEIYVVKEDEYIVEGSVRIEDINELIGTKIESEEFDSIGGFIIGVLGRFPNISEEIIYSNYRFIIEDIDRNRIKKIRIYT